jgi:hypothetical protein
MARDLLQEKEEAERATQQQKSEQVKLREHQKHIKDMEKEMRRQHKLNLRAQRAAETIQKKAEKQAEKLRKKEEKELTDQLKNDRASKLPYKPRSNPQGQRRKDTQVIQVEEAIEHASASPPKKSRSGRTIKPNSIFKYAELFYILLYVINSIFRVFGFGGVAVQHQFCGGRHVDGVCAKCRRAPSVPAR